MVPYPYYSNHFFVFFSFTRHVFNMQWWPWAAICSETWRTLSLQVDLSNSLWISFVRCRAQRCLQPVAWLRHWFASHQPWSTSSRIKTHVTAVLFFWWRGGGVGRLGFCEGVTPMNNPVLSLPVQSVACPLSGVTFSARLTPLRTLAK